MTGTSCRLGILHCSIAKLGFLLGSIEGLAKTNPGFGVEFSLDILVVGRTIVEGPKQQSVSNL